jgi:hypothetical protein
MMGVSVQNSAASAPGNASLTLSAMNPYTPENRTIDIYMRGSGSTDFTISSHVSYVKITPASGTVSYPSGLSDIRATISVDWASAPTGFNTVAISITQKHGTEVKLTLPLNNFAVPADFKGYVESNGAVAMEMQHFSSRVSGTNGATMEVIPDYGRTDSGLTLLPMTAGTQSLASGPKAIYSVYTVSSSSNAKVTVYLPPSLNVNPLTPLKYAIALDNATPTTVTPVPSATLGAMPNGWEDSVVNGARVVSMNIGKIEPGKHELSLWLLEPGTVVQRLVLDLGGVKSSYLGPLESTKVGF